MTSAFARDTEDRMNFYKHMQNRRRRRLPHVERAPSRQLHTFWPTFRGALAWMRKNQDTINTALGLLDIYPSLIQDSCMDRFWEFVKPFVSDGAVKNRKSDSCKNEKMESSKLRGQSSTSTKMKPQIPTISVTNDLYDDTDDIIRDTDMNQRKSRIYISGQPQTDFLTSPYSKLTSELITDYTVQPSVPINHSASKVCETLAESDVFIFLMSQESVSSPSSYRDLSAAWTMDIPVLFIKPPGFKLPNPLPDSVLMYSLESRSTLRYRKAVGDKAFSHSATPSSDYNVTPVYRNGSPLPRIRPSSAHECSSRAKSPLVHRDSCDVVLMLINGYRNAVIWDPIYQHQSYEKIKGTIEKLFARIFPATPSPSVDIATGGLFGIGREVTRTDLKPESGNLLQVPTFDVHSPLNVSMDDLRSDDSLSINLPSLTDSNIVQSLSDPEDVTSPTEKETFYVVFKDRHSPGNVIKWPPINAELEKDDVFADSPLSFQDVDLTMDLKTDFDTSDCDSATGMY